MFWFYDDAEDISDMVLVLSLFHSSDPHQLQVLMFYLRVRCCSFRSF